MSKPVVPDNVRMLVRDMVTHVADMQIISDVEACKLLALALAHVAGEAAADEAFGELRAMAEEVARPRGRRRRR